MKVILKQDVKGTGKKGAILEVSDGEIVFNEDEISEIKWCGFDEALQTVSRDSTAEFFLQNAIAELKKNKI